MKRNMRQIFEAIANLGNTLESAISRAIADAEEYGAGAAEIEKRRAVTVWRRAAVEFLQSLSGEIESLRDRAAADSRGMLGAIRSGRKPKIGQPGAGQPTSQAAEWMSSEAKAQIRASEAATATMATVNAQLAFSNRLAVVQLESTADLREQMKAYLEDAERGETFDYESFAIDAKIVPLILRRRADGGDLLADHTVSENVVGKVETALLRRGGPDLCDDADLQLVERVRTMVDVLDPSTLRGLADVQDVLAMIGRLVGLKVVNAPPRELPAPRHRSQAVTNPDWTAGRPAA